MQIEKKNQKIIENGIRPTHFENKIKLTKDTPVDPPGQKSRSYKGSDNMLFNGDIPIRQHLVLVCQRTRRSSQT